MPNKTFFNLSHERQIEIIEIALKEFTEHDYESASLNRIIAEVGVAKGSFYRYFKNKNDLYKYLVEYVIKKRFKFVDESLKRPRDDFFQLYKEIMYKLLKFNIKFPLYSEFINNYFYNNNIIDSEFESMEKEREFMYEIIVEAQEKGQLRKDMKPEFIFFCIVELTKKLWLYINDRLKISQEDIVTKKVNLIDYEEKIKSIFDQLIEVFKFGISL